MPGGDRTGPAGMGPMTGRAAGYCTGNQVPGFANPVAGRGYGFAGRGYGFGGGGRGRGGMGRRNGFYATGLFGWQRFGAVNPFVGNVPRGFGAFPGVPETTKEQELEYLKSQAQYLTGAMDDIKKRIADLEAMTDQQSTSPE
ncbi:MAG: DUF5320 domain-containing protein [Sedimentisphaerales bacterium]|nr:DUF5320 domain-containing protein [Sedimentisphaerales bacterium]